MDSKEKENINEEELKAQAVPEENGEEATEKEEVTPTEEEKLAQELEKAHAEIEDQKDKTCVSPPSSTTTANAR